MFLSAINNFNRSEKTRRNQIILYDKNMPAFLNDWSTYNIHFHLMCPENVTLNPINVGG